MFSRNKSASALGIAAVDDSNVSDAGQSLYRSVIVLIFIAHGDTWFQMAVSYTHLQVACSPDAKHVAFVVTKPSIEKNCYCSNIWVLETESGTCRKLTGGDKESDFLWLDNERLLFSGDRKQQHKPQPGQNVTCLLYTSRCV